MTLITTGRNLLQSMRTNRDNISLPQHGHHCYAKYAHPQPQKRSHISRMSHHQLERDHSMTRKVRGISLFGKCQDPGRRKQNQGSSGQASQVRSCDIIEGARRQNPILNTGMCPASTRQRVNPHAASRVTFRLPNHGS